MVFVVRHFDVQQSSQSFLTGPGSWSQLKTTGRKIEIVEINAGLRTDRQSDQLKNRKFYENFSGYANFSKSSGKGHKTKGQIL